MYSQSVQNLNIAQNSGINAILSKPIPKIKVIVRKRPLNSKEESRKEKDIISIKNNTTVVVSEEKQRLDLTKYIDEKDFLFDNAYDETSNNSFIYEQNIRPLIFSAFYYKTNVTCFAFGQTGSGKTYTMLGSQSLNEGGMYSFAGFYIFNRVRNDPRFDSYYIKASF